ncbi:MAG: UDP-N-acetylmuramate dehydrogenase [Oscillospiraceae bacterium]
MNKYERLSAICQEYNQSISFNEPMSRHTSFLIGGPADAFIEVENKLKLREILNAVKPLALPVTILGNGSNLLVSDKGIEGIVIKLSADSQIYLKNETEIFAGAGASLLSLCKFARKNALSGLEFAFGIPGTVGGAVYMNAGAYGGEMKDVIVSTEHLNKLCEFETFGKEKLLPGYRTSVYKNSDLIITEASIRLEKSDADDIGRKMDELMARRCEKQPLNLPSAGSVFKRPKGMFAGAMIEHCGLKGYCVGGAEVSEKHAGFIVNKGDATCQDVLNLIDEINDRIYAKYSMKLETEISFIGRI